MTTLNVTVLWPSEWQRVLLPKHVVNRVEGGKEARLPYRAKAGGLEFMGRRQKAKRKSGCITQALEGRSGGDCRRGVVGGSYFKTQDSNFAKDGQHKEFSLLLV